MGYRLEVEELLYKKNERKRDYMKEPRRFKELNSNKASSIKTILLLLAIFIVAGIFTWLQFFPKSEEEAIVQEKPTVEQINKTEKPPTEIIENKDEPTVPEGKVINEIPKVTQPIETIVEERVEERDQEAILASILPKVYTVYTESQQGSGFLYNVNGDIVTNAHVVAGYSTVTVTNNTGQEFVGQVIGISDSIDVALIRVEAIAGKEPLEMDLMKSTEGTNVIAIGSPNNQSNTATTGKVTATGRDFYESFTYTDLYEIDAPIAPGSSGGPLLDALTEKVIGINSIILTDNPAIGFSIPMYSVYQLLQSWEANPLTTQEPPKPNLEDAYFDEELLTIFIEGYTTLYTYAQNEVNFGYLEGYLLPNSQIYKDELVNIGNLKDQQKMFTVNKFTIDEITIEENRSLVTATIESVMTQKGKEPVESIEQAVYEVIIDEYGDYMIQAVTKKDLNTEEEPTEEAPADEDSTDTESTTEGTTNSQGNVQSSEDTITEGQQNNESQLEQETPAE